MKKFLLISFLLFLLLTALFTAWAAGIRFHPAAIPAYFSTENFSSYVRLDLKDGRFVVGRRAGETEDLMALEMAKRRVAFSKSAIARITDIPAGEMQSGAYADWVMRKPRRPILTKRRQDSLLAFWEKKTGVNVQEMQEKLNQDSEAMSKARQQMRKIL